MRNKEQKVIILENLSSPFISQAIIILKDGTNCAPDGIIAEAERIVSGYFPQNKKNTPKKSVSLLPGVILAISSAILTYIIMKLL